ncbi:MAG: type II toxin-antitoxin system HigB family toxin [Chloroflexi bacterium]|nr:type II toxin-antitoxin system HigB family toxin [Chloroflexota bacterium]
MRILSRRALREFTDSLAGHRDQRAVRAAFDGWYADVKKATWSDPADLKRQYGSASVLKDRRAVFNVCGNKYRLVVKVNYVKGVVYIRFVGSHAAYDAIDAEEV